MKYLPVIALLFSSPALAQIPSTDPNQDGRDVRSYQQGYMNGAIGGEDFNAKNSNYEAGVFHGNAAAAQQEEIINRQYDPYSASPARDGYNQGASYGN